MIELEDNHGNCKTAYTDRQNEQEFFYTPDEEVKITGDYHNVRIFITDIVQQRGSVFDQNKTPNYVQKWSDTKIQGVLRIMMI